MARKVTYWTASVPLVVLSVFAAFTYLSGNPQAVQGFAHVGYPQQLRIILGIAKLLGAIALVVPGIPRVKSGPMPDLPSPGSPHSSLTISPKMVQGRSRR